MAILKSVSIDATNSPTLTNQLVMIPLSNTTFDFSGLNTNGRNLDVLDSDGVTSLAHSLRSWRTGVGLWLSSKLRIPASGLGHAYTFGTCVATGNLGLANPPHTIWGAGSSLAASPTAFGEWNCYDKFGTILWTFRTTNQDYPMSVDIGDLSGTGTDPVAAVGARDIDSNGYILNANGTQRWSYSFASNTYVRIAKIGKLTADAGNQVLFGGALGKLALCDKLGNQKWNITLTATGGNATVQAAIIDDLVAAGTNYVFCTQSQQVRKIDGTGAVIWTFNQQLLPDENFYSIASGHITSTSTKQLVVSSSGAGSSNLGVVLVLDNTGTPVWQKIIPYPSYAVTVGDVNGDGFDEVILTWGTSTGFASGTGWGGVLILDKNGQELAAGSLGSAPKFVKFVDFDGSGTPNIQVSCDDGNLYRYRYSGTGGTVKVTIPSVPGGAIKTISIASNASSTFIPDVGDFFFDLSGANGTAPPNMTQFLSVWTIQANKIQSPDDGDTAVQDSIEATGVSSDAFEFEFDLVKSAQGTGAQTDYYGGCRYRCTNWSSGLPKGFLFQLGAKGSCNLFETASGTATVVQTLYNAGSGGLTFNTTDVISVRIVVSGTDHSAAYRKNGGPWKVLYRVVDPSGTPNTAAGTVALYNGRGRSLYSNLALRTMPAAFSVDGTGPAPVISLTTIVFYTLTQAIPSSGVVNVASNVFTVTPSAVITGTVTVQPSGGGLTNPIVLNWAGSAAAQTFTITPTSTGVVTLTPTNSLGISNPASVTYTANPVPVTVSFWPYLSYTTAFKAGLGTQIGYTVYNPDGSIYQSRSTAGVVEIASAKYFATVQLPFSGARVVMWDDTVNSDPDVVPEFFAEPASSAYPSGVSIVQAMAQVLSILTGKTTGGGTTFYAPDGGTPRLVGTASGGDRTSSVMTPPT